MALPEKPASGPGAPANLEQIGQESLLAIFGVLREAVLAVDTDLTVLAANQATVDLLGHDLDAMIGKPVCDLFGIQSCPADCLRETMRTGRPVLDYQTTIGLADGRRGQVLIRTAPLHDRRGKSLGAALMLGDVTEVTALRKKVRGRFRYGRIIGKNSRMQQLYGLVEDVAPSEATVLIRGESGTGKELVARAVHLASGRADGPFVEVNCSALAENLLESELFGHVKGAFTGAVGGRKGRFEEAHGGTLFLDEIGDISPVVQVKLLRVLQERVVERVGDNRPIPVNVRIVSATNRNLEELLAAGRMREDFYYRIRVVTLQVPPLRDRREDIPHLAAFFLARLRRLPEPAEAAEASVLLDQHLEPAALAKLLDHRWPGNVRELENALEHAHVLSRGGRIGPENLPAELGRGATVSSLAGVSPHSEPEKDLIAAALDRNGWNRSRTARQLGVDRTTLWRKIREYGLRPEE